MPNFLKETLLAIAENHLSVSDIVYIGSLEGHYCEWKRFKMLSNYEYETFFDNPTVAIDLVIIFEDGTTLERTEDVDEFDRYKEFWTIGRVNRMPDYKKPLLNVFSLRPTNYCLLSEINP